MQNNACWLAVYFINQQSTVRNLQASCIYFNHIDLNQQIWIHICGSIVVNKEWTIKSCQSTVTKQQAFINNHCLTGTKETPDSLAKFLGCLVRVILAIPSHLLNFVHLLGGNERVKFHSLPVERGGLPLGHYPLGHSKGHPLGLLRGSQQHKASQGLAMWGRWP